MKSFASCASVLALLAVMAMAGPAHAGPWLLQPKEFYSSFLGGTERIDDWFNGNGDRVPFAGNATGAEYGLTSYNEFGWKEKLGVILLVPFKSVTYVDEVSGYSQTTTGFQDFGFGFRYAMARGHSPVSVQVDWRGPSGYNPSLTPPLGEGSQDISGQLLVGSSLPSIRGFVQAAGGYRARFGMRADTVVTSVGGGQLDTTAFEKGQGNDLFASADLGVWIGSEIMLAGNVSWFSESGRGPTRSGIEMSPRLIFRVDNGLDLVIGSTHTFSGENTSKSDEFLVGLAFKRTKLNRYQGYLGNAEPH